MAISLVQKLNELIAAEANKAKEETPAAAPVSSTPADEPRWVIAERRGKIWLCVLRKDAKYHLTEEELKALFVDSGFNASAYPGKKSGKFSQRKLENIKFYPIDVEDMAPRAWYWLANAKTTDIETAYKVVAEILSQDAPAQQAVVKAQPAKAGGKKDEVVVYDGKAKTTKEAPAVEASKSIASMEQVKAFLLAQGSAASLKALAEIMASEAATQVAQPEVKANGKAPRFVLG